MSSIRVNERELKQAAKTSVKYSTGGGGDPYIFISWGKNQRHHIRVDLDPFDGRRFQKMQDGEYNYKIREFHVKLYSGPESDAELRDHERTFDYLCFVYDGGNIWAPTWNFRKIGRGADRKAEEVRLTDEEWGYISKTARDFIYDLGRAIDTPQMVRMKDVLENA